MPAPPLPSLPDDARLWLFAADRALGPEEAAALLERARAYAAGWTSHARPVAAAAEVLADRVLAVGGAIRPEELNAGVSGCGIDSMTRAVDAAAAALGLRWLPALDVLFLDPQGEARAVPRAEFRRLAREGAVTAETPVFDLTADTVGALRARGLVRPAGTAWHGAAFGLAAPAASPV